MSLVGVLRAALRSYWFCCGVVDDYSIATLAFRRIQGGIGSSQNSGKVFLDAGIDHPEADGEVG